MATMTDKIKEAVAETIDKTTHLDVASATQVIAKKLGLKDRLINYTHIELRNKLNEYGYKQVPYTKRVLFLPHCLRNSKECKAKYGDEGLVCKRCGKCDIDKLISISEELDFQKSFIVPGGSMVRKIVAKHQPNAVVGVCCYNEANLAIDVLRAAGIHGQACLLIKDGCKDTKAHIEDAREKMQLIDKNLLEMQSKGLKK